MEDMNKEVWPDEVAGILGVGIYQGEFGINNWALTKLQALDAITELEKMGIPVLGGDVCEKDPSGRILPNYDNWYCEPLPDESKEDFVHRSIQKTREYIENYPAYEPGRIFFNLVPDVF